MSDEEDYDNEDDSFSDDEDVEDSYDDEEEFEVSEEEYEDDEATEGASVDEAENEECGAFSAEEFERGSDEDQSSSQYDEQSCSSENEMDACAVDHVAEDEAEEVEAFNSAGTNEEYASFEYNEGVESIDDDDDEDYEELVITCSSDDSSIKMKKTHKTKKKSRFLKQNSRQSRSAGNLPAVSAEKQVTTKAATKKSRQRAVRTKQVSSRKNSQATKDVRKDRSGSRLKISKNESKTRRHTKAKYSNKSPQTADRDGLDFGSDYDGEFIDSILQSMVRKGVKQAWNLLISGKHFTNAGGVNHANLPAPTMTNGQMEVPSMYVKDIKGETKSSQVKLPAAMTAGSDILKIVTISATNMCFRKFHTEAVPIGRQLFRDCRAVKHGRRFFLHPTVGPLLATEALCATVNQGDAYEIVLSKPLTRELVKFLRLLNRRRGYGCCEICSIGGGWFSVQNIEMLGHERGGFADFEKKKKYNILGGNRYQRENIASRRVGTARTHSMFEEYSSPYGGFSEFDVSVDAPKKWLTSVTNTSVQHADLECRRQIYSVTRGGDVRVSEDREKYILKLKKPFWGRSHFIDNHQLKFSRPIESVYKDSQGTRTPFSDVGAFLLQADLPTQTKVTMNKGYLQVLLSACLNVLDANNSGEVDAIGLVLQPSPQKAEAYCVLPAVRVSGCTYTISDLGKCTTSPTLIVTKSIQLDLSSSSADHATLTTANHSSVESVSIRRFPKAENEPNITQQEGSTGAASQTTRIYTDFSAQTPNIAEIPTIATPSPFSVQEPGSIQTPQDCRTAFRAVIKEKVLPDGRCQVITEQQVQLADGSYAVASRRTEITQADATQNPNVPPVSSASLQESSSTSLQQSFIPKAGHDEDVMIGGEAVVQEFEHGVDVVSTNAIAVESCTLTSRQNAPPSSFRVGDDLTDNTRRVCIKEDEFGAQSLPPRDRSSRRNLFRRSRHLSQSSDKELPVAETVATYNADGSCNSVDDHKLSMLSVRGILTSRKGSKRNNPCHRISPSIGSAFTFDDFMASNASPCRFDDSSAIQSSNVPSSDDDGDSQLSLLDCRDSDSFDVQVALKAFKKSKPAEYEPPSKATPKDRTPYIRVASDNSRHGDPPSSSEHQQPRTVHDVISQSTKTRGLDP